MMSEYKLTQSTQIDGFRDQINSMVKNFGDLQGQFINVVDELAEWNNLDPKEKLTDFQRRIIK